MDEKAFNEKLQKLIREIINPPKDKKKLAPYKAIKEKVDYISKSLADLQLLLKYILFDLEATRRERDKLKDMLENNPNNEN